MICPVGSSRNRAVQVSWPVARLGGCAASLVRVAVPGSYSKYCEFLEKKSTPDAVLRYSVPATTSTRPFGCRQAGASLRVSRPVGDRTRLLLEGSPGSAGKSFPAGQVPGWGGSGAGGQIAGWAGGAAGVPVPLAGRRIAGPISYTPTLVLVTLSNTVVSVSTSGSAPVCCQTSVAGR